MLGQWCSTNYTLFGTIKKIHKCSIFENVYYQLCILYMPLGPFNDLRFLWKLIQCKILVQTKSVLNFKMFWTYQTRESITAQWANFQIKNTYFARCRLRKQIFWPKLHTLLNSMLIYQINIISLKSKVTSKKLFLENWKWQNFHFSQIFYVFPQKWSEFPIIN